MNASTWYDFELWKIRVKITRQADNTALVYVDGALVGSYSAASVFIPNEYAIENNISSHKIDAVFFEMILIMENNRREHGDNPPLTPTWEPVTEQESNECWAARCALTE